MKPTFKIKHTRNKQFYFTLQAANGKTIATGETYTTKRNCINAIHSIADSALAASRNIIDTTRK